MRARCAIGSAERSAVCLSICRPVSISRKSTAARGPIEGVGTACAAFVGFAPAGPANEPVLVTNWSQYVETFGSARRGRAAQSAPARRASCRTRCYGYFLNGGGRCYVTRVGPACRRTARSTARSSSSRLQLPSQSSKADAVADGQRRRATPKQDIEVEVAPPTGEAPPDGTFTLQDQAWATTEEVFENISLGQARRRRTSSRPSTQTSKLVTVVEEQAHGHRSLERMPEVGYVSDQGAAARSACRACSPATSRATSPSAAAWRAWRSPKTSRWSAART